MSIAKQSISAVTWNAISNGVKIPIGFIQSILLARLLPIEVFGVYGGVFGLPREESFHGFLVGCPFYVFELRTSHILPLIPPPFFEFLFKKIEMFK